jgi:hypothetical protein
VGMHSHDIKKVAACSHPVCLLNLIHGGQR